jgi:hypothetical protein
VYQYVNSMARKLRNGSQELLPEEPVEGKTVMRHFKKTPWAAGFGTCLLGCLVMSSTASAEAVSYDFTGTIHSATSQFSAGTTVIGSFGYNTAAASLSGGTSSAASFDALTSFSFSVTPGPLSSHSGFSGSIPKSAGAPTVHQTSKKGGNTSDQFSADPSLPDNATIELDSAAGDVIETALVLAPSLDLGSLDSGIFTVDDPGSDTSSGIDGSSGSITVLDSPAPLVFDLTSLTLVPEPGSLALFGGGLLGLALLRRRKAA